MKKNITVGITGHRDIVQTKQLKQDIAKLFKKLQTQNQEVKLLSPLADGADRLVANIYLEIFKEKAKLIVPMPFHQERYMEDFDSKSQAEFLEYLKITKDIIEVENTQGCNYKSVGVFVVDKCDILLALWDGTFNKKSGGTGDIVHYARDKGKEVVHFVCERMSAL
ncbi:MAG: hypothetical protein KAU90_03920 [Sulfurovaceae bacterium]|nr:hypothetical protein [Sulfurovaceae bacterium]